MKLQNYTVLLNDDSQNNSYPFKRKSVFLFGPRQVGKSTLVKHLLVDMDFLEINLLKGDILLKYKKNPSLLTAEIEFLKKTKDEVFVFIDEIKSVLNS